MKNSCSRYGFYMIFTEIVTHSDSHENYSQGCEKFLSHLSDKMVGVSCGIRELASPRRAPVDSFSKILGAGCGVRDAGCGVREGGGLMAAEYLWGFCTGGFEKIFKSKRHRPPEPGGQRAERAGGCSIAACRNGRATACV